MQRHVGQEGVVGGGVGPDVGLFGLGEQPAAHRRLGSDAVCPVLPVEFEILTASLGGPVGGDEGIHQGVDLGVGGRRAEDRAIGGLGGVVDVRAAYLAVNAALPSPTLPRFTAKLM